MTTTYGASGQGDEKWPGYIYIYMSLGTITRIQPQRLTFRSPRILGI